MIYIKNRTFEKFDSTLANNVFHLVSQINKSRQLQTSEIQFDCDWTISTRDNYFEFLRQYKKRSQQSISATIRLHQVKYKNNAPAFHL